MMIMRRMMKQSKYRNESDKYFPPMLLVCAMILGAIMPEGQYVSCATVSSTLPPPPPPSPLPLAQQPTVAAAALEASMIINQNESSKSNSGQIHYNQTSMNTIKETTSKNSGKQLKLSNRLKKNNSTSQLQMPIDLIFFDRISANNSAKSNNSNNQTIDEWTLRHTYNISNTNKSISIDKKNDTIIDPMDVSDSRYSPQRLSSRLDTDEDNSGESSSVNTNEDAVDTTLDSFIDGASSNLIEKKVVKELTKILSRGMSGATDQVRLETLENLKRRQRERKVVKDTRAKAFEEILNTAINSHPDRFKKGSKASKSGSGSGMKYSASSSQGSSSGYSSSSSSSSSIPGLSENVGPELATDAETVLQHLQGLSSALDAHSPAFVSSGAQTESAAPDDGSNSAYENNSSDNNSAYGGGGGGDDSSEMSTESNQSASDDENRQQQSKKQTSSDRPLVRQLKKIKNQISQRRKQLDQIKKLFNVELSINPKDGSLMGKPAAAANGGKKKGNSNEGIDSNQSDDVGESTGQASTSSNLKRSKSSVGSKNKVKDLMNYLKENPEILASVMSELTVDADPTNKAIFPLSMREEGPYQAPSSLSDASADLNIANLSSRKTITTNPSNHHHHQQQHHYNRHHSSDESSATADAADAQYWLQERNRRLSRVSLDSGAAAAAPDYASQNEQTNSGRTSASSTRRTRQQPRINVQSYSGGGNTKTAEALLLESLRERQLLNLARLDMVLAERASSQASSNRSSIYSSIPQRLPASAAAATTAYDRNGGDVNLPTTFRPYYQQQQQQQQQQPTSSGNYEDHRSQYNDLNDGGRNFYQRSDEEVSHHFMVVNGNKTSLPINEQLAWNNYQPQQQQQQQQVRGYHNGASAFAASPTATADARSIAQQNFNTYKQQQQYQEQQLQPLKRFRDWRDVGQSEASSWQTDRITQQNATWPPYDLTTGSSASASTTNQYTKLPSMLHYQSIVPNNRLPLLHQPINQVSSNYSAQSSSQMANNYNNNNNNNSNGANPSTEPLPLQQQQQSPPSQPSSLTGVSPPYQHSLDNHHQHYHYQPNQMFGSPSSNSTFETNMAHKDQMRQTYNQTPPPPGVIGSDISTVRLAPDQNQQFESQSRGQKFNISGKQQLHSTTFDDNAYEQQQQQQTQKDRTSSFVRGYDNINNNSNGGDSSIHRSSAGPLLQQQQQQAPQQQQQQQQQHKNKVPSVSDDYDTPGADYFSPYKNSDSYRGKKRVRSIDSHGISMNHKSHARQQHNNNNDLFDDDEEVKIATTTELTPNDDDMGAIW